MICAVLLDITEKCEATSLPAGRPATAPIAAVADLMAIGDADALVPAMIAALEEGVG